MNSSEKITPIGRAMMDRRGFLQRTGMTLGGLGLAKLLAEENLLGAAESTVSGKAPIRLRFW